MNRRELIAAVAAHTGLDPKQVASVLTGLTEGAKRRPERHRTSGRPGRTSSPCGSSRTKDADQVSRPDSPIPPAESPLEDGPPRGACPSWGVPTRRDSGAPAVCLPPGRRRAPSENELGVCSQIRVGWLSRESRTGRWVLRLSVLRSSPRIPRARLAPQRFTLLSTTPIG